MDDALHRAPENADPDQDTVQVCQRQAAPASAELGIFLPKKEATKKECDDGNAELKHPAIGKA